MPIIYGNVNIVRCKCQFLDNKAMAMDMAMEMYCASIGKKPTKTEVGS